MKCAILLCVIYVLTSVPSEIHAFSTTQTCIDEVVKLVKEKRSELSTEFFLSNKDTNDSLRDLCEFFVPHKIHKVLTLLDKETCKAEIPTTSELEEGIYITYVQLLNELKVYVGLEIPDSFGQIMEGVTNVTKTIYDRLLDRLTEDCLHIDSDEIE